MISWIVAQAGLLFVTEAFSPVQVFSCVTGTSHLTVPSLLVGATAEHIGWYDSREMFMPTLMNSHQGALETRLPARSLTAALAASLLCAVVVSAVSSIWLPYTHGGVSRMNNWTYYIAPQMPFSWTQGVLSSPSASQTAVLWNMVAGAVTVLSMFVLRTSLSSFTLHPVGFVIAASYPSYAFWFSLFLGWLLKTPLLRYGGIVVYRRVLPFFLGLIVGDCLNAFFWIAVGFVTHVGYNLMPN